MPRHNPYDISYTQANDPVDCASHSDFGLPAPPKDPLENMLYDKYVTNYAQLVSGSSNLVGLASFTSEAGESDLVAPSFGWSNGIKHTYLLGDAYSRMRTTASTHFPDFGAQFNPNITLVDRRDISFGAESGWVDGFVMNRYGGVNEPDYTSAALAESADLQAYISGEFTAGRATHMFYWMDSNYLYNNHKNVPDSYIGQVIYSGAFDEPTVTVLMDALVDQAKVIIGTGKSAGAKGIVIGGAYNRFLFPTGVQMGFTDPVGIGRVDFALNVLNSGLKQYAQTIGGVFVDYREFQKDMQGIGNDRPFIKFPPPYSHYHVRNQTYDSAQGSVIDGEFVRTGGNGAAMFSTSGLFYYNLGQSHITNIMLHALNKCYGTRIKLIDPTEMVQLCGLRTTHTTNMDRVVGGGSGLLPQKDNGGTIIGNESRSDLVNEGLGSKNPIKNTSSSDFPENLNRANQSSVRFGGANLPKRQDYDPRTG